MIERRPFLRAAGLAVLAAPVESPAQAAAGRRVIGFLGGASAPGYAPLVEAFRLGLRDHGYVEDSNIKIEYRWADGRYDRLPVLATELVRLKVYCEAGGLLAYGVDFPHIWRQSAVLVDKILKGTKPADLPIQQATRFELVINVKTERALGLTIPTELRVRADQLIDA